MWIESMSSFEIQCNTEGLQIVKAGINTKIQSQKDKRNHFYMKNWHDSCLPISPRHFMCTLLDEMELVKNMGQRS